MKASPDESKKNTSLPPRKVEKKEGALPPRKVAKKEGALRRLTFKNKGAAELSRGTASVLKLSFTPR
jgi:hypothetical protein